MDFLIGDMFSGTVVISWVGPLILGATALASALPWNEWFGYGNQQRQHQQDILNASIERDREREAKAEKRHKEIISRYDKFKKAQRGRLKDLRRDIGTQYRRRRHNITDYIKQADRFSTEQQPFIQSDRDFWQQMRDRTLDDWIADKQSITDYWTGTRDEQSNILKSIQRQQLGLADELRTAPSTVMEQARMMQDQAMSQSVALAGAMGGGISSNYANLENMASTQQGDLLTKTSALRANEYANRINQRSGILNQASTLGGSLIKLGTSDASIRSGLSAQNYNTLTGLGKTNVNIGTTLQGRGQSLLNNVLTGTNMLNKLESDYIKQLSGITGMYGNQGMSFNKQDYNWANLALREQQQNFNQSMAQQKFNMQLQDRAGLRAGSFLGTLGSLAQEPQIQGLVSNIGNWGGGGSVDDSHIFTPDPGGWDFRDVGGENIGLSFNSLPVRSGTNMPIGGTGYSGFNFRGFNNFGGFA